MTGPRRPRGWVRVLVVLAIIAASRSGARPGAARSARAAASPAPADSAAKHASTAPEPPFHISARNLTGGHGPEGDVLFLNGDIHVTRGRTLLTADSGRYVQTTRLIDLQGHVKLIDSTTTATCDHAEFSENDDRLNLDGNVVLVDREATLRSPMGWYDRRNGTAYMGGGVTGTEKQRRMTADEATYLRDSMIVKARGHVKGYDDENKLELDAQAIDFYRRTQVAIATGEPVLTLTDDDGKQTVMRALKLTVDSDTRIAEAVDSVRVVRDTLQARANYARFDDNTGQGILLGSPRAWDNETNVVGDTLLTLSQKRKLERVVVIGHSIMDYAGIHPNNLGETSRLTGARLDAYIDENRIDSLRAVGHARNDYAAAPRLGKTHERNLAIGDTILVYFKDRKVERARVEGTASGEYRPPVDASDTSAVANEVVRYDGRHIDFIVPKNQIVLDGAAHLTYRELELNAKRVEFDSQKQTLVAQGSPQLLDKGDKVDGRMMTYDLGDRVGTIYEAKTNYEKGIYRGEKIRKVGDNELDVMNGSFTTCDLDHPHYHFAAHWMKIYLKDKLVAKPVVFYIENVPVLALPFYVFPIKPGRHSGFLFPAFELGFNNQTGEFIRNAGYYWAPNDYMDLTLAADYYQADPSYTLHADGNYKLLYAFDGTFSGRYTHDDLTKEDDYEFDGSHTQDITPRTRLIARGDFVSSRAYNESIVAGSTLEQRLNRFLTSSLSITHTADWAAFNVVFDRRQDLDADQSIADPDGFGPLVGPAPGTVASLANLTTDSPDLSIQFPSRTLGSYSMFKGTRAETLLASTYVNLGARFLSYGTRQAYVKNNLYSTQKTYLRDTTGAIVDSSLTADSTTALGEQSITRRAFATNFSLSDARRLFGWLNLTPTIAGNGVIFDHDELGHELAPAATWGSSVGLSTTYYGTFKPPIPFVAGLRHVVFPSVSLNYSPDFRSLQYRDTAGVLRPRFDNFGGISIAAQKSASMSFSLDQRLQAKLKEGDKVARLDNLLDWTTAGSYDFLWREHGLAHGLTPLSSQLTLQPPGFISGSLSGGVDAYQARPLRTLGFNVGMNVSSSGARQQPAKLAVESANRKDEIESPEDFKETWRLSLAYSYSGGYQTSSWSAQKTANGVVSYQMTPNWQFDYSAAYDVTRSELLSQRFSLTRILHCWDAVFTRSFVPGGVAEYYFRLGVRDEREIYYERGSAAQSFGGIQ